MSEFLPSKVYFVGAGPGAVDLLTLRAARLLAEADIVLYDALVGADILALAPQANKLNVGKRSGRPSMAQRTINVLLVDAALSFKKVVRLKGGDPGVFGRLNEELVALRQASIAYEIVPGITTALAAAAQLGVSLTERGVARSLIFATPALGFGEDENAAWSKADHASTLCLYMAGGELGACARRLISEGWAADTPLQAVQSVSSSTPQVWTGVLGEAPSRLPGPVVVLIGRAIANKRAPAFKMEGTMSADAAVPSSETAKPQHATDQIHQTLLAGAEPRIFP